MSQRVVITHGAIIKATTAKRRYRCQGHMADAEHFIEPGEQHVRTSLPPDHPEINNDTWWHMRLCLDCVPAKYDTRDTTPARGSAEPTGTDRKSQPPQG